jgi:hypothetical protein
MTRDRAGDAGHSASLPWWWNASLIALGLAMALFRLIPTEADPDLWGHVRFGLDTMHSGLIVRPDIYSYMSGLPGPYPWINHEWLAELLMADIWHRHGAAGLVTLKVVLGLAVAFIACRHMTERAVPLLGALLMTAYGMAVILPGLRSFRPQAFTYVAFALLLVWIHRASRGRLAFMLLAPPLMACWASLHGGFVAGLGVIALWLMTVVFGRHERGRKGSACAIAAASVAATLATPYGWTLWTFLARTLGPRPEIAEWQGVSLVTVQGLAYLAVAAAGVTGLFLTRRPRARLDIVLMVCAGILPLIAQRHLPLTVLIVLIFGGEHIASAAPVVVRRLTSRPSAAPDSAAHLEPEPSATAAPTATLSGVASSSAPSPSHGVASGAVARTQSRERSDRFRPLVAAALLVETCVLIALIVKSPTTGQIVYGSAEYPVEAVARLADLAAAGGGANVAVHFNWGEYVIWHAGPDVKVSMDGRRETVYSDAAYHDNSLFFDGVGAWDRLLAPRPRDPRGETDLALVPAGTAVYHLMSMHSDWELVTESGPAALFGRRGSPVTSHVHAIPARALGGDTTLIFP